MSNALCSFFNLVITCFTALQAVMDRMEQMDRSMEQMRADYEESIDQMERSIEELKAENRRSMNIGPEMDQEIDTNAHQ